MESKEPFILNKPRGFNKGSKTKMAPTLGSHSWERNHYVSIPTNGTNTPTPSTEHTSESAISPTSEQLTLDPSPTLISSVGDFLAKLSQLLENAVDLMTPEEHYSLTSLGFSKKNNLDCVYWKTSKDCYLMTMAELSKSSSPRLQNWGMMSNGKCVTQRISVSPKTGSASSLSDILEEHPDQKYFLSSRMVERIMGYRDTSQTPLPPDMKAHKPQERTLVRVNSMHKASQADRVYSKKGISPTIPTAGGGRHIPQVLED